MSDLERLLRSPIEQARDAPGPPRQQLQCVFRDDLLRPAARGAQVVKDIIHRLLGAQWLQTSPHRQTLTHRLQVGLAEGFQQGRLRAEDDLEGFALPGFQVTQKAQLLQHVGG